MGSARRAGVLAGHSRAPRGKPTPAPCQNGLSTVPINAPAPLGPTHSSSRQVERGRHSQIPRTHGVAFSVPTLRYLQPAPRPRVVPEPPKHRVAIVVVRPRDGCLKVQSIGNPLAELAGATRPPWGVRGLGHRRPRSPRARFRRRRFPVRPALPLPADSSPTDLAGVVAFGQPVQRRSTTPRPAFREREPFETRRCQGRTRPRASVAPGVISRGTIGDRWSVLSGRATSGKQLERLAREHENLNLHNMRARQNK